jgi:hypothetical protein
MFQNGNAEKFWLIKKKMIVARYMWRELMLKKHKVDL